MTAPRIVPPYARVGPPRPLEMARAAASAVQARPWLAALTSAALLWACHFPLALGPLAWVALVPLLTLIRSNARPRTVYLAAWLCGLAFFVPALQWLRVADPRMYYTWIGLALYCSIYVPLAMWLLRRLDRGTGLPLALTVPVVWVSLEWLRGHFGGGFPWYFLGHTQHAILPLIQVADLGGAYVVSALVAAVNGVIVDWLTSHGKTTGVNPVARLSSTLIVALLVVASLGYGAWRLNHAEFAPGPRVALVQGNVPQQIKDQHGQDMIQHFRRLCDQAAAGQPRPDLIVWPETSYGHDWFALAPGADPNRLTDRGREVIREATDRVRADADHWQAPLLLGLNTDEIFPDGRVVRRNSALLGTAAGAAGRYDKIHCVPFGEYVPFRESLPWMERFSPYDYDYSIVPGADFTAFVLPVADGHSYRFGALICYEDSDTDLARVYVRPGGPDGNGPVDFLVNLTNDGWFDGTAEHEEHLAISRFRAVECRRSLARAANMGISAVIDPDGRVIALPADTWAGSKKIEAVVTAAVPIDHRVSHYAAWGDWLPAVCAVLLALGLVESMIVRRRSSS